MIASKKKPSKTEAEKKVLRLLAKARREPRLRAQRERDALIDAIRCGHSDIAHSLLAHGVDPNSTEAKGRSALWYAAHWGRSDLIQELVRRGAPLPNDVLMGPVHDGDVDTVRFLIRRGANVNCLAPFTRYSHKFPKKEVLLTQAIQNIATLDAFAKRTSQEAIPLMLIKAGANVNRLAFEYSVIGGFIDTILGLVAHRGLARTTKAMLAAGADVNQRDTWGGTALFAAARKGHGQIVKILLAAGARTDFKRRDGATPISIARERGFSELANEIERHKAGG